MLIKTISISLLMVLFIFQTHPLWLSIYIILIMLASLVDIHDFTSSHWFSYILCIVFLGGLLILFVYVSSLVPASKTPAIYLSLALPIVGVGFYFGRSNEIKPLTRTFRGHSFQMRHMVSPDKAHFIIFIIAFLSLILFMVRIFRRLIKVPLRKLLGDGVSHTWAC